ncbi:aldo/keto reductase [Actinomadura luteofluorescens]|uniref:aldo/keto reductase n=1 Tax=Actinomadura luteofluorescens TaxID=46163 RepID=UPI003D8FD675
MDAIRRLGVGLAALGRPAYINVGSAGELPPGRTVGAMREATWSVLDAAYAAGVRWVDTARSYGRAEEFLGGWLAARAPEGVRVSSKWGYAYVGEWKTDAKVHEVKEHSLGRFQAQYEETRSLLGGHLAVYQVHSLTEESPLFQDVPLQEALAQLSSDGVRVGFSTSGPRQADTIRRAMGLEVAGQRLFSTVQSTWNILESSAADALREAHDNGLHVLLKEVLANGRLAVQPPQGVQNLASKHAVGPDALALAAALGNPWADTVLIGAVSPAQLQANLAATDVLLDEGDLQELAQLNVSAERYWAERGALSWT